MKRKEKESDTQARVICVRRVMALLHDRIEYHLGDARGPALHGEVAGLPIKNAAIRPV
jgi:hypothetical protein